MMEYRKLLWCFYLISNSAVCAIQTLHNIEDLKEVEFGHKYPRHGLLLLHWLASHISILQTEDILLHFNPLRQDYGFQLYQNTHNISLPHLDSMDSVYYSLGSLSTEDVQTQLPPYVTQDFYNFHEDPNRDIDRIVIRVQKSSPTKADQVYITQAMNFEQENNQNKTYQISSKLLKQVQALQKPLDIIQVLVSDSLNSPKTQSDDPRLGLTKDQLLIHLQYNIKRLETIFEQPGLRWLLSLAGYDVDARYDVHKKTWLCSADEPVQRDEPETLCEGHRPVKIDVKSTADGYARLTWSGIPKNIIEQEPVIVLFSSESLSMLQTFESVQGKASGSVNTYVALNQRLQPRLIAYNFGTGHGFIGMRYSVFWRGPQFDSANRVIPTDIKGYNASLQLYTREGYACARLYIKNSFTNWKKEFQNSWVGFYSSKQDLDKEYQYYQWVSKFEKVGDDDTAEYLVYKYESPMSIGPGVQARFLFSQKVVRSRLLLGWFSPTVKARTVPWEDEES